MNDKADTRRDRFLPFLVSAFSRLVEGFDPDVYKTSGPIYVSTGYVTNRDLKKTKKNVRNKSILVWAPEVRSPICRSWCTLWWAPCRCTCSVKCQRLPSLEAALGPFPPSCFAHSPWSTRYTSLRLRAPLRDASRLPPHQLPPTAALPGNIQHQTKPQGERWHNFRG